MTDRVCALTVILDHDMRTDDADDLVRAIRQLKNVANVVPEISEPFAEATARTRLALELQEQFRGIIDKLWSR